MRKNGWRMLAWLLLLVGFAGGPVGARIGRTIPAQYLRWAATAGAVCLILSFFWFPRRAAVAGAAAARKRAASRSGKRIRRKRQAG